MEPTLVQAIVVAVLSVLAFFFNPFGAQEQAEFYRCEGVGGDHIVACAPGTSLTGCEHIGSGMTDKNIVECQ